MGAIVEAVSGQPYADYLAAHVFGPLQMTHTFSTIDQARSGGLAEGFSTVFGAYWQRPVSTPEALQPSATTFSSAEDLAHEIEMYLAAGSYHGTPLISPDTEKALHAGTPVNDEVSYSMGWWLRPQWELSTDPGNASADAAVATVIEHGGDWDNTSTYMGYVPSTGEGLVVLINANSSTEGSEIARDSGQCLARAARCTRRAGGAAGGFPAEIRLADRRGHRLCCRCSWPLARSGRSGAGRGGFLPELIAGADGCSGCR